MTCKYCNATMCKDDVDYNFKGCYDVYWVCDNCQSSCVEQVRFGKSFQKLWHSEIGDKIIDEREKC